MSISNVSTLSRLKNLEIRNDLSSCFSVKTASGTSILNVDTKNQEVKISANLNVLGNAAFTNTNSFSVEDNLIELARGNPADVLDTGFFTTYNESAVEKYAGLIRESGTGNFKFFNTTTKPNNIISNYTLGNVIANNFTGNFIGNVSGSAATVSQAAQPNITSLGTLTSLTSSGNITAPRFITSSAGSVSATALQIGWPGLGLYTPLKDQLNIAANSQDIMQFFGTGINCYKPIDMQNQNITNINTLTASTINGNISGSAATVSQAAQPNITSLGTLTGLTMGGTLNMNSNSFTNCGSYTGTGLLQITRQDEAIRILSGSGSWQAGLTLGRIAQEAQICINVGNNFANATSGDLCIRNTSNNIVLGKSLGTNDGVIIGANGSGKSTLTVTGESYLASNTTITSYDTALNIKSDRDSSSDRINIIKWTKHNDGLRAYMGYDTNNSDQFSLYVAGPLNLNGVNGIKMSGIANASTANTLYYNTSTNAISYASSSLRHKENIVPLSIDSSKIYQLSPVEFDYKESKTHDIGYIAETVDNILPELVGKDRDGLPDGIKYINLIMLIIEEMKKLKQRILELENAAI